MRKLIFSLLLILLLGFICFKIIHKHGTGSVAGFGTKAFSNTTTISKIISDPRDYEGKEVSVHGRVETSFNFWFKYYVLNDGTGTIYIVTEKAVPKVGEDVQVTGIFNQQLKIGNLQVETITEK